MPLAMKLFAPLGQVSGFLNILMSCLLKGSHLCQKIMSCEWPLNEELLEGCRGELLRVFILSIGTSELWDVHTLWNSPAMNSRMCSDIFLKSVGTIGLGFPGIPMAFEMLWPKFCPVFMGSPFFLCCEFNSKCSTVSLWACDEIKVVNSAVSYSYANLE